MLNHWRRAIWCVALVVPVCILGGPVSAQADTVSPAAQDFESVPFVVIDRQNTEQTPGSQAVARDDKSYALLWARHYPAAGRPAVNFGRFMVAAMFLGQAGDGCHIASVRRVLQRRGATRIEYLLERPDKMLPCLAMLVYPSVWITLPQMPGRVEFIRLDRP